MDNDPTRLRPAELSELQQERMRIIKTDGRSMLAFLDSCGSSREIAIAKTKVEEAVMWAVKGITG
jgi:hypothetical protein